MELHELRPAPGSTKNRKRVGRGISAGQGKTAGRGTKGQFARSGARLPKGFEGGQLPLTQRLPHLRGFHNPFRVEYQVVNLGKLKRFDGKTVIDPAALIDAGLANKTIPIKLLGAGVVGRAFHVRVHRASAAAIAAVEAAGGKVELLAPVAGGDPADTDERVEGALEPHDHKEDE